MITLHYKGTTESWDTFTRAYPPNAIALDGFVSGRPRFQMMGLGPFRNFNHHEDVDRSTTLATCEQARRAILLGLYDTFQKNGVPDANLWVNDCDEDVCLASWLLMHPTRASEPLVRTLSQIEDLLDSSSGMFPMPHTTELLGKVRWIFEPCFSAKKGFAHNPDMIEHPLNLIEFVHARIDKFLLGQAKEIPAQQSYQLLSVGHKGWRFYIPNGSQVRAALVAEGCRAGVAQLPSQGEGCFRYSLWRLSEYVEHFPVGAILSHLYKIEPGWGGSNIVGGSPRPHDSKIPPDQLAIIIDSFLGKP